MTPVDAMAQRVLSGLRAWFRTDEVLDDQYRRELEAIDRGEKVFDLEDKSRCPICEKPR